MNNKISSNVYHHICETVLNAYINRMAIYANYLLFVPMRLTVFF